MARLAFFAAAALALALPASAEASSVVTLPEGEFYRPSGAEVSGVLNATTTYTRSPCPALNTMANHGYIPRDGKNLSRPLIKAAIMKLFNLDEFLASTMVGQAPNTTFTLADLGKHNMIEHDVSFSRADAYLGADPSLTTPSHMQELLALATPTLTLEKTAWLRARRLAECEASNPKCEYTALKFTADFQSALMLRVLGGQNKEEISYEYVRSFFDAEKLPDNYTEPSPAVLLNDITSTITALGKVNVASLSYDLSATAAGSDSGDATTATNATNATTAPSTKPAESHAAAVTTVPAMMVATLVMAVVV